MNRYRPNLLIRLLLPSIAGILSWPSSVRSQTLLEGLDHPPGLGPITTHGTELDERDYPAGVWKWDNAISHDGVDSALATLPNRKRSFLDSTVEGPAVLSFWWKIDAVAGFDALVFRSENEVAFLDGIQDWQHRSFEVDSGIQTIQWYFERRASLPIGTASAWVDQLTVVPIPNSPTLQGAVENYLYTQHSTKWVSVPLDGAANSNAASSGSVGPGETSTMVFEADGPAEISFDWAVQSDGDGDTRLEFLVDNSTVTSLTAVQDLARVEVALPPGHHGLKFRFYRDPDQPETYLGEYRALVDQLSIVPIVEEPELADAVERPSGAFSTSWSRLADPTRTGGDVAIVSAPTLFQARRLYLNLPDTAGLLSLWSRTDSDAEKGFLYVSVDGQILVQQSGKSGWQKTEANLPAKANRHLEAIFYRTANLDDASASTRAFLDEVSFIEGANNYQPDLLVGPKGKPLRGSGIQNSSAAGQVASVTTTARKPFGEFAIRCGNSSSTDADTFTLRSIGGSRDFDVLLVVASGGKKLNYGAALKTGRFKTKSLAPGSSESHEIWVVRKRGATRRTHSLRVIATSEKAPDKLDAVQTKLRIGR